MSLYIIRISDIPLKGGGQKVLISTSKLLRIDAISSTIVTRSSERANIACSVYNTHSC